MSFTSVDSFRWHIQGSNDTSAIAKSDDNMDAPTNNDTPEEGTEDEDMPELMLGGTPHCLFCDPRVYNAEEVMLMSTTSTSETASASAMPSLEHLKIKEWTPLQLMR